MFYILLLFFLASASTLSAGYCNENKNYGFARGSSGPVVKIFYYEQNLLFNATAFSLCKEIISNIIIISIIIIIIIIIVIIIIVI